MASAPEHLFRKSPEEKRAQLSRHFGAAIEPLLESAAYNDLRVEEIIRAGGVSRATFYAYFKDKTDLLRAMTEGVVDQLHQVAFWRIPRDGGREELRAALRQIGDTYREHRLLLRSLVDGAGYDEGLRSMWERVVADGVQNVKAHIVEGQEEGSIAPFLNADATARLLVSMGERALYQSICVENAADNTELLDSLTEVFWRTLYEGYR